MRKVATWIVTVVLALEFLHSGYEKLTSAAPMVRSFELFGYPLWFMYFTGALEVVCAALLFVPRLAFVGAGLLVCTMIGAIFSHLTHGQADKIAEPVILLVLAAVLGTLRNWGRSGETGTGRPPSRAVPVANGR